MQMNRWRIPAVFGLCLLEGRHAYAPGGIGQIVGWIEARAEGGAP
ncbi:MAG: hypothetical protein R3E44_08700 [Paracoccaceae bacterium]